MSVLTLALVLVGCASGPDDGGTSPAPVDSGASGATPTTPPVSGTTASTAATATTGLTGDTAPPRPTYDCSTVPVQPVSTREMPGATGYHDLAFTAEGRVLGSSRFNRDLMVADAYGASSVFVPQIGEIEQMVWLPDGDLAVASTIEGIVRVAATGGRVPIQGDIRPYGLILGPDGLLYAADQARIVRVDPTTGATEVLLAEGTLPAGSPRVIAFDLAYERMFIGTRGGSQGRIYVVDLDATYTPSGPPRVFASGVGTGDYHDAIGVDLCGYLYVPDYTTSTLWRITPQATIVQAFEVSTGLINSDYPHGVAWGSGVGGWRDDAIYVPMPYRQNKVREIVVGVPHRDTAFEAVNLPTW